MGIVLPGACEPDDRCPKCLSKNVAIGACVLSCFDCGWGHLNKYPCSTCGGPATSCVSGSDGKGNNVTTYGCPAHPLTKEQMFAAFEGLGKAILSNAGYSDRVRGIAANRVLIDEVADISAAAMAPGERVAGLVKALTKRKK